MNVTPDKTTNASSNLATKRTAVNTMIFTFVIGVIYERTGWVVTLDQMYYLAPLVGGASALFYRLSRVVAAKWPNAGYVLFGSTKAPTSFTEVPKEK